MSPSEAGSLSGKTALVLGATGCIGRAAVLRLVQEGVKVAAAGRNRQKLQDLCVEAGAHAGPLLFDMEKPDSIEKLFGEARRALGPLDFFVNCVNRNTASAVSQATLESWEKDLQVNLVGTFLCCQKALAWMKEKNSGKIVNIVSESARMIYESQASDCATKSGMAAFTKSLALEAYRHSISASVLCAGSVVANPEKYKPDDPQWMLRPEDVAEALMFLVRLPARAKVDELLIR